MRLAFAAALLTAFGASLRAEPLALDLAGVAGLAAEAPLNVQLARERIAQALAQAGQARAAVVPQLGLSLSGSRQTRNIEASGLAIPGNDPVVGPFSVLDARIRLTQSIFDATAWDQYRAARAQETWAHVEAAKVREDAMALAATQYLMARRAQSTLRLSDALLRRDEEQLRVDRARSQTGVGTDIDLQEAAETYNASLRNFSTAKNDELQKRLDLLVTLGLPPDTAVTYQDENLSRLESFVTMTSTGAHPDVVAARGRVAVGEAEAAAARADLWPKASLFGDAGRIGTELSGAKTTYTLGAQVTLPVLEGGRRKNLTAEMESRSREDRLRLADIERQTQARLYSARESLDRARALLANVDAEVTLSRRKSALARQRQSLGVGSGLDAQTALAQEAQVQDRREEAIALYGTALVNWVHAQGRMDWLTMKGPSQ